MKKAWKIILSILIFFVVITTSLLVWQWDNIMAIYTGITVDETKLEERIAENKKKFSEIIENEQIFDQKVIDGFSKEDEEKIAKGEITVEEAVDKLFEEEPEQGENVKTSENQPIQGQQNPTEPNQKDEKSAKQKELLQAAVKEMYTLKAGFTKRLADLEREGKRMYIADNGKNMTMENKLKIADYLMPQFVQAEKECDAKVETVLTTLSQGLKEIGADTSVVETIRKQYKEEKQLKKTQYIKEYL